MEWYRRVVLSYCQNCKEAEMMREWAYMETMAGGGGVGDGKDKAQLKSKHLSEKIIKLER